MEADGVALVTGAGRGLGRALARALARRGFEVVGTVRSDADAEALRAEAARDGLRLRPLALDVRRAQGFVPPDGLRVLVNNAAVDGP